MATAPMGLVSVIPHAWMIRRPWFFSKPLHQRTRQRRTAADDGPHAGEVGGMRLDVLEHALPDGCP
jgi:hypothetical protein